jgi:hypothetical protein
MREKSDTILVRPQKMVGIILPYIIYRYNDIIKGELYIGHPNTIVNQSQWLL